MSEVAHTTRGPLINVATWITVSAMVITVISKIFIKWTALRKLQPDDYLMFLAAVFAIGQSATVSEEIANGLGQHESVLSPVNVDKLLKAQYASSFLYISAVFVTKIASLSFFATLINGPLGRRTVIIIRCVAAFCLLWLVLSYFVLGFQCQLPHPWNYGTSRCLNKPAFWTATAVVDIITQIFISLVPFWLLRNLRTTKRARIIAMIAFTPNLLTIPLIITRMVYVYKDSGTADRTWDWYNPVLLTSIHAQLSILLGALPFLKPLIDSMVILPGMIPADDMTVVGDGSTGYSLKVRAAGWSRSMSVSTAKSATRQVQRSETIAEAVNSTDQESPPVDDGGSPPDRMRILQTRTFAVTNQARE